MHPPSSRPDPLELSTTGRSRVTQFIARHKPVVADVNVLTPDIALQTLGFSLLMGLVGGFIHAWRAARLNIVDGLRAA